MRARIVRIGNSQGIRIPKALLEQTGFGEEVDLEVRDGQIILRPLAQPRQGWETAFQHMAEQEDDALLDSEISTVWEAEEWQW